jgi:hypothetical protein
MWSYLMTRPLIGLLPDYVENKVMRPKVLRLDEIVIVIMRFDQIASFGRANACCTSPHSLMVGIDLGTLAGIKESFFARMGDLCESVANGKATVTRARALYPVLATVPDSVDAAGAFLQTPAPNRLL